MKKFTSEHKRVKGRVLAGHYVAVSFDGCDFRGFVLSGKFLDCDFAGADLREAILSGTFDGVNFVGADLRGVDVEQGDFTNCRA